MYDHVHVHSAAESEACEVRRREFEHNHDKARVHEHSHDGHKCCRHDHGHHHHHHGIQHGLRCCLAAVALLLLASYAALQGFARVSSNLRHPLHQNISVAARPRAAPPPTAEPLTARATQQPHAFGTPWLVSAGKSATASVRGNLGAPRVVTESSTNDWLRDRWQAAKDMSGTPSMAATPERARTSLPRSEALLAALLPRSLTTSLASTRAQSPGRTGSLSTWASRAS